MFENVEMRKIFYDGLEKLMESDERIVVIDADLAKTNGTLPLRENYPERAFEAGIAEQNMTAVAAGMASYGFIPFISSFAAFASRRACDQIAVSIAYSKQNVKIVGSDPGVGAELNGGTHMGIEDVGVLRSIPGMVIFEPVDGMQLMKALPKIVEYDGPVYMRLFRKQTPDVFGDDYEFELLKADMIKEGRDVTIFCSGIMVSESLKAWEILKSQGIDTEIINIHTLKPIDSEAVINSAKKTKAVVTCENHNIIGGLRSAVAEVLIENCPVPLRSIGIRDMSGDVSYMDHLMKKYHMTAGDIINAVKEVIKLK